MFYLILALAVLVVADALLVATIINIRRFKRASPKGPEWQQKPEVRRWVRVGNASWIIAALGTILFVPADWPYGMLLSLGTAIPLMAIMIVVGDGAFGEGEGAG